MFKNFLNWINSEQLPQEQQQHSLQLATAVLLFEIMRSDDNVCDLEIDKYKSLLLQHFALAKGEVEELLEQAKQESTQAVDYYQYTSVINQHYQQAQKVAILESLWQIAFADGRLDAHEEHVIRRLADLLHIPHSSFIKTKITAETKSPE